MNFAKMLNEQWKLKMERSNLISNNLIDECIEFGLKMVQLELN